MMLQHDLTKSPGQYRTGPIYVHDERTERRVYEGPEASRVLAKTGQGHWRPEGSTQLWLSFNLRAHHMQAQTVARRFDEAPAIWLDLDRLVPDHGPPDRVTGLLHEAVLGYRVRRPLYIKLAGIEERTATRDLARLTDEGILQARGERRGRHYVAGETLRQVRERSRQQRRELFDPYPGLPSELASTKAIAATGGTTAFS
jgi:hypothetical protein